MTNDRKEYQRKFYIERYKKREKIGLCTTCGINKATNNTKRCEKCREKASKRMKTPKGREYERLRGKRRYKENPEYHKEICKNYIKKLRNKIYELYGDHCECCNESIKEFLTIDHINNKGEKHRKENYPAKLLKLIIKENNKSKYRILCMNCNWGRRFTKNKICPHKTNKIINKTTNIKQ